MNICGILLRIEHIATWIDFYPISFGGGKNQGEFCRRLILLQVDASTVKGNQRMFHMRLTTSVSHGRQPPLTLENTLNQTAASRWLNALVRWHVLLLSHQCL